MAKIPVYNENKVGVSRVAQGYEQVNANASAFGATGYENLAQGFNAASSAAANILKEVQEKDARALLLDFSNKWDANEAKYLNDPNEGYFAKKGRNAIETKEEVQNLFKKQKEDVLAKLKNNEALFLKANEMFNRKYNTVTTNINKHYLREKAAWRQNVHNATLESNLNKAILNRNNPEGLKAVFANLKNMASIISDENGDAPEVAEFRQKKVISGAHVSILQAMLQEKNINAKEYFEENKKDILPEYRTKLLEQINVNDLQNQARIKTDEILAMGLSYEEQLEKAKDIKDTKLSDTVIDRIKVAESERRDVERQSYNQRREEVFSKVEQTLSFDSISSDLKFSDRERMKEYIRRRREGKRVHNKILWANLYRMSTSNPDKYTTLDLNNYATELNTSHFDELVKLQEKIKTGKIDQKYTTILSNKDVLNRVYKSLGIGKEDYEKQDEFVDVAQDLIIQWEDSHNRKIPDNERQAIYRNLALKEGWGWGEFKAYQKILENQKRRDSFLYSTMEEYQLYIDQGNPHSQEKFKEIIEHQEQVTQDMVKKDNQEKIDAAYENYNNPFLSILGGGISTIGKASQKQDKSSINKNREKGEKSLNEKYSKLGIAKKDVEETMEALSLTEAEVLHLIKKRKEKGNK